MANATDAALSLKKSLLFKNSNAQHEWNDFLAASPFLPKKLNDALRRAVQRLAQLL